MAIRQYIGARYVPRFIGTYDPTQIYEALDVVDNGSGTSYIARKNVPAGTPLTDADYWFVYGASSGAIIQLQNDMQTAQNDILTLQGDMTNAQGDITSLNGDITALENEIRDLGGGERQYILVADSYGGRPTAATSWQAIFEGLVAPATVYKWREGTMGFVHPGSSAHTAESLMQSQASSVADPDKITDVVIALGGNDIYYGENLTSVKNAMQSIVTYVKSVYPNAVIWFGYPNGTGNFTASQVLNVPIMLEDMQEVCEANVGCRYLENIGYIMRDAFNVDSDKTHPNTDGSRLLGQAIAYSVLSNRVYHYFNEHSFTIENLEGVSGSARAIFTDGLLKITHPKLGADSSSVTFTGSQYKKIGQCSDIPAFDNATEFALVACFATAGSGDPIPYVVRIALNANGEVTAQWYGAGARTLTAFIIPSGAFELQTMFI